MFGSVIVLTACGGGGGGGSGPSYVNPSPSGGGGGIQGTAPVVTSTGSVNTPTLVATINPLASPSTVGSSLNMYAANLSNNGTQSVVAVGGESHNNNLSGPADAGNWINSAITVFGWTNGQLVNQTGQWFSGTDNIIVGTPKVSFGNFNGNGNQSMFVAPFTDGILSSSTAQIFINNGSTFTRYNIALPQPIDSMDSTTFSYHGIDNIVALGYPYSEVIMGSTTNNFVAQAVGGVSGSSIAAGNFLGTGNPSFVVGQYGSSTTPGAQPNALIGFAQDPTTGIITMPLVNYLPTPLFNTASYFAQTGGSNTVKVVKMDFDESGIDSVFILAMPNNYQNSPWQSSIQFLKNNGSGVFTDVTATTVTGYDMTKPVSMTPTIIDLLNTGLPDIVLPTPGSTQVLMQVSKGQYVASMASTITNFTGQVQGLLSGGQTSANSTVTFVQGPNNNLYLLGNVPETINGTAKNSFYLSQITGNTVALNAQQAITAARTAWPWLTNTQLNTMIVATGSSFAGIPIINDQALLSPSGTLSVANKPISGYIAGINMNGSDSNVTSMDSLGRSFSVNLSTTHMTGWSNSFNMDTEHIDQYELTSHTEYLINGAVNSYGPLRVGAETRNQYNTVNIMDPTLGPTIGPTPVNFTIGMPRIWQSGNWSAGTQYTTLNYNPWLAFGGSWGSVTQTGNFDTTLRYNLYGFSAVAGTTYTTTQMNPGMITKVGDIYGAWGEAGYHFQNNLGIYAGVKPVVLSGNVSANLPSGVDNNGNVQYTGRSLALQNQTTGYVRALWSTDLNKHTFYRISGTAMTNGQYRLMNELRYNFD